MNCYQAKAGELTRQWYVIDASEVVVGRLAAQIAPILMGKHRPTYTPHVDTGDFVIVTNVDKVVFTGNKWRQKSYQRYSGYPSGQREEVAWKLFQRRPERILELAVTRMMPKNKIGRHMLLKLKMYVGPNHPHQAQAPIPLEAVNGRPAVAGALWAPVPEKIEESGERSNRRTARIKKTDDSPPSAETAHAQSVVAEQSSSSEPAHDHAPAAHAEAHDSAPTTGAAQTDSADAPAADADNA